MQEATAARETTAGARLVAAVNRALQSVALGLLEEHLSHCVAQAINQGDEAATQKVREAADAIARLVRS